MDGVGGRKECGRGNEENENKEWRGREREERVRGREGGRILLKQLH